MSTSATKQYRYSTEIAQMCFVYAKLLDPDESLLQFIEDTVKHQITEVIYLARAQAIRRGSRQLGVEDLIFLIRKESGQVSRIITYLGWKDVRKKVKDSEAADEGLDLESMEEPSSTSTTAEKRSKANERRARVPWLPSNVYSTYRNDEDSDGGEEDAEIDYDLRSYDKLKEADAVTTGMTQTQYQYYSECRQASFTHRKAKRFRDFLNVGAFIDQSNVSDEIVDVLGFFACEMVRSLCESGIVAKRILATATLRSDRRTEADTVVKVAKLVKVNERKRKRDEKEAKEREEAAASVLVVPEVVASTETAVDHHIIPSTVPMSKLESRYSILHPPRSPPRLLITPSSLFTAPSGGLLSSPTMTNPVAFSPSAPTNEEKAGVLSAAERESTNIKVQDLMFGLETTIERQIALKSFGFRNWSSRGGAGRIRAGLV